jgi:hypothetical protein
VSTLISAVIGFGSALLAILITPLLQHLLPTPAQNMPQLTEENRAK